MLVFDSEWKEHQSHDVVATVTKELLDHPTQLLLPLEERKAQAVSTDDCFYVHTTGMGELMGNWQLERSGLCSV